MRSASQVLAVGPSNEFTPRRASNPSMKRGGCGQGGRRPHNEGGFVLSISIPCDVVAHSTVLGGIGQVRVNIDARLAALFGLRTSLSVDRRDGRHSTCLRYPCARLTQESSAI